MKTRQLGYSDLSITPVGIGTWAIGGAKWDWGWGKQDDQDSIAAIRQGIDNGMNWIDTAPVYGLGHAEEVVAKAVENYPKKVLIFTKCANLWEEGQTNVHRVLKASSIIEKVDDSLRRLNIEVIDLLQIHWPNEDLEEGWGALATLVKMGKIRYAGVCNCNLEQLERIQPIHPVVSLQNPYNLFERSIENHILNYCAQNQIGILAYSPLANGLLTGKYNRETITMFDKNDWRRNSAQFNEPHLSPNLQFLKELSSIAERLNLSLPQLAISWVLQHAQVTAAIVGVRKPQHATDAVPIDNIVLSTEVLKEIEVLLQKRDESIQDRTH